MNPKTCVKITLLAVATVLSPEIASADHDIFDQLRDVNRSRRRELKNWYDNKSDAVKYDYRQNRAALDYQYRAAGDLPRHVRDETRRRLRYERKALQRGFDAQRDALRHEYRRLVDDANYDYKARRNAAKHQRHAGPHCGLGQLPYPPGGHYQPAPGYSGYERPIYRGNRHEPAIWERAIAALLFGNGR